MKIVAKLDIFFILTNDVYSPVCTYYYFVGMLTTLPDLRIATEGKI